MLGDGFEDSAAERGAFFQEATDWYESVLSEADGSRPNGIRPYHLFSQAFRVRAVFEPSVRPASPDRLSRYRVKIDCDAPCDGSPDIGNCEIGECCWTSEAGVDNHEFRTRVFAAIDGLVPPVNYRRYPGNLSVSVPVHERCSGTEINIVPRMADAYSNLVVLMLVRTEPLCDGDGRADGKTSTASCTEGEGCGTHPVESSRVRRVRVALGAAERHEFGHAFGYLIDEYIEPRDSWACHTNPVPGERSVFLLSNLSYSDSRCDMPWAHIAPGSHYNPNPFSQVGNFVRGGNQELGVWHSEYKCLMNGQHKNYFCDIDEPDPGEPGYEATGLKDERRLCFWCEEIIAIRILERTGQFGPEDPSNERGRVWFALWETTLRDAYYQRFNIPHRIAQRDACLGFGACPCPIGDCVSSSCDRNDPTQQDSWLPCNLVDMPACLPDCTIREISSAMYVDSAVGAPGNPGTRFAPVDDISDATQNACGPSRLVAIEPGSYPAPLTISEPAVLIPSACDPVVLGN